MTLRSHVWNELRSPEISQAKENRAVVLIPVGATEQHGLHLPLDTDINTVTRVCIRAAELSEPSPTLVVKVMSMGFSPHHMVHAGTLSLRLHTFTSVIVDTVVSIWRHGFRKILIVNGHGGNIAPLAAIANELTTDGYSVPTVSYWDLVKEDLRDLLEGERKTVGHACEFETSLMLFQRPNGVDMTTAVRDNHPPWNPGADTDIFTEHGVTYPAVFRAGSSGVLGDPTLASADKGRRLFELASERLATFIIRYRTNDLDKRG